MKIIKVKTLDQWKKVLKVLFDRGNDWRDKDGHDLTTRPDFFTENKSRYLYVEHGEITHGKFSPDLYAKVTPAEEFLKDEYSTSEKIYTVTKQEMEILQTVKNHAGIGLLKAVSNRKSELAAMESIGNGAILRWIGGDDKIKIVVEEPKWRLTAIDKDGDKAYVWVNKYGIQGSTSVEELALTGNKEELAKYKSDFWTWEEVDE